MAESDAYIISNYALNEDLRAIKVVCSPPDQFVITSMQNMYILSSEVALSIEDALSKVMVLQTMFNEDIMESSTDVYKALLDLSKL